MDVINRLIAEHDNILRMLDVIHAISLESLSGKDISSADIRDIISFIRIYADKTHHGKEEEYLFYSMTKELGVLGEKLIRHGMLVEHDLGRLYVSELETAIAEYEKKQTNEATLSIIIAAGSYEQLLRRHIEKENDVVFSFGEKNLSKEQLHWINNQMDLFDNKPENELQRTQQLEVLNRLEEKYISRLTIRSV